MIRSRYGWLLVLLGLGACEKPEPPERRMLAEIERDLQSVEDHLLYFLSEQAKWEYLVAQRERHKDEILEAIRNRSAGRCVVVQGPYRCSDLRSYPMTVGTAYGE